MSEIGQLRPKTPNSLECLTGEISTLQIKLAVTLSGDESLADARQPSHSITARGHHGTVEIGKAWLKTAKHGPQRGERFFSITIDDPGLATPLNVGAFCNKETGDWAVVWRRRGPQPAANPAT